MAEVQFTANATSALQPPNETKSIIRMVEIALLACAIVLILVFTVLYIFTRMMRHKHMSELREMEKNQKDPLRSSVYSTEGKKDPLVLKA